MGLHYRKKVCLHCAENPWSLEDADTVRNVSKMKATSEAPFLLFIAMRPAPGLELRSAPTAPQASCVSPAIIWPYFPPD